ISILSQLGNHQLAVDEAAKPIRAGSKEPTDHYWYTQALAQAGRKEEAEKAYRDALQLPDVDKKQPELWVQFVFFLVQSEQKAKAEAVTQEVEKRLPAELAPLVLARCYEALGQTKKAEEQYLKALAKDPRQLPALRSLANFYERHDQLAQAEPYLRRLLEPETKALPADLAMARRALAGVLASTGSYDKFQEGQELLKQNAKGGKLALVDQHAQAKLYTKRVYHWRQAIELYEQLQSQPGGLALDEPLDLARLYESYRSKEMWAKARQIYLSVLNTNPERADLIYRCTRSFLKNHEPEGMQAWFAKLQKLEGPQSPRVREIQVRLLMEQNKLREGADLLKQY